MVKNGNQKTIAFDEVANYQNYVDIADLQISIKDHKGKKFCLVTSK